MAKPGSNYSASELGGRVAKPFPSILEEFQVDSESNKPYNKPSRTVKLRSTMDSRLEYFGQETGKLYIWNMAGSVVEVQEVDASYLLGKRLGKDTCCGSSRDGRPVFELA
jgi:hypothetical protein